MGNVDLQQAWSRVERMFKSYGFPYKVVSKSPGICWNGEYGNIIDPTGSYRKLSNAIHEFSHWIVAADRRRTQPEFGLGSCPDAWGSVREIVKTTISFKAADLEESHVSVLGILIEKTMGLDPMDTAIEHSWEDPTTEYPDDGDPIANDKTFQKRARKLVERGILRDDLTFPLRKSKLAEVAA